MRVRSRGEEIRCFILEHIEKHPKNISKLVADKFGITRQAVNKHLQRLSKEKSLGESGNTRNRTYKLASILEWKGSYQITSDLEEHVVWEKDIAPFLGELPENVMDLWQYGFTEMFNNAKDHSAGTIILVTSAKTAVSAEVWISDDGIGIFKKIQDTFNLEDQREAILELSKGKLTTDPAHHSGEGIFFSSRMFDTFCVGSDHTFYSHQFGKAEDWIMSVPPFSGSGTVVGMRLSNHTSRTTKKIFDQFTSDEDFAFNKTVVPVKLAQYGNDKLISRSQAKRVLARLERFRIVLLDFEGVPEIGQAFADEVFRVFPQKHPQVEITARNASSEVKRMIERARSASTQSGTSGNAE